MEEEENEMTKVSEVAGWMKEERREERRRKREEQEFGVFFSKEQTIVGKREDS